MILPLQAALFAQAIYNPITPGMFSSTLTAGGITVGITDLDGYRIIAFPGSEVEEDWIRDFDVEKFNHPQFGVIHKGMWAGMEEIFTALLPQLTGKLVLIGHSLGGAHASFTAGLCSLAKIPVQQLFLFAPPRHSFKQFRDLLQSWVPQIDAWQNVWVGGKDPIPDVPLSFPIFEPWVNITTYQRINEPPADPFDWVAGHSLNLYIEGMRKISLQSPQLKLSC